MPKLKCIGGMCDGEWASVHENFCIHDTVRIPAKIEFEVTEFNPTKAMRIALLSVPYYIYKICVLEYKDISGFRQKLHYLVPENWHEFEALRHMFAVYNG